MKGSARAIGLTALAFSRSPYALQVLGLVLVVVLLLAAISAAIAIDRALLARRRSVPALAPAIVVSASGRRVRRFPAWFRARPRD